MSVESNVSVPRLRLLQDAYLKADFSAAVRTAASKVVVI